MLVATSLGDVMRLRSLAVSACLVTLLGRPLSVQHEMRAHAPGGPLPAFPGQAAFTTIGQVAAILELDSTTDWSNVNLDALREHLIDMDEVLMRASVEKKDVPGGFEARVTGTGRTGQAIRRMLTNQAAMLDQDPRYRAVATEIANGIRLTVTAKNLEDAAQTARIRGLGFAGILTEGDHHPRHHLAIARGDAHPHDP